MADIHSDDFWEDFKKRQEEVTSQTVERDARYGFKMIRADTLEELEVEVLKLLKAGWRPTGGTTMQFRNYFQTMYKV